MYRPYYDVASNALVFSADEKEASAILSGPGRVYVCGGLQNPDKMRSVLGRPAAFAPAVVTGYRAGHIEVIDGREIPFMIPADPAAVLPGVVWLDLSEQDIENIEKFELAGGHRRRITIQAQIGQKHLSAFTYIKK